MDRFEDVLPTHQAWIHDLARGEILPDSEKLLQLGKSFEPQQLVEESCVEFLTRLREIFTEHTRIFNAFSENGTRFSEIKIYSVAQTSADFMLFRNQIKLIFSSAAQGIIQISFNQHSRGSMAVNGVAPASSSMREPLPGGGKIQELLAQLGPFRDVYWTFQGEKVDPEQIAKFYFAEFARVTREIKRSRIGNELLLDQIKTFLQEKGLDL